MRPEGRQTGFEKLTGLLVVQAQLAGQLQNHRFAFGKEISLFPVDEGTAMNPNTFGKPLLCEVLAAAYGFEQRAKGGKVAIDLCHVLTLFGKGFFFVSQIFLSQNVELVATFFRLYLIQ
jgi:hypothetical protein